MALECGSGTRRVVGSVQAREQHTDSCRRSQHYSFSLLGMQAVLNRAAEGAKVFSILTLHVILALETAQDGAGPVSMVQRTVTVVWWPLPR